MKEYEVSVTTNVSGFNFFYFIDAESKEEAEQKALEEAENDLRYMINHLKVAKIEEGE